MQRSVNPLPRVLVVLPAPMIARNWLSTSVLDLLAGRHDMHVTVVTSEPGDESIVVAKGLRWRTMLRGKRVHGFERARYYFGYLLYLVLANRFNAIAGFRGARERLKQSRGLRRIALKDGLPASPWFGFPMPRSRLLFGWLKLFYQSRFLRFAEAELTLDETQPSLLVLGHVQNFFTLPYALAAASRGLPILGAIGSWDQPTTKGPLNPALGDILVQSRAVAGELVRYHDVARDRIELIGWTQMDLYRQPDFSQPRAAVLAELGLSSNYRYVLMGAYPERLGRHEPVLCAELVRILARHDKCALVIRCHPIDVKWKERFYPLHRPPAVIVIPPELDNLKRMANQIQHSELVLSSAGTILLDAVALDAPAVAIAMEDEREPYYDRVARRYDMEHWSAVVATGGLPLARSVPELTSIIEETLADRQRDAAGRRRLRAEHLEPLDGCSAERLVAAIAARLSALTTPGVGRAA